MKNKIYPAIWCDGTAKALARFYGSLFAQFDILYENPVTVAFQLNGHSFLAINGGDIFRPNPSISLYTTLESESEIRRIWSALIEGGSVNMPLDKYDWSPLYGWVADKYGVSWQLTLGKIAEIGQQIIPALMYTNQQYGRAMEAIQFYSAVFPRSATQFIFPYPDGEQKGKIAHAQFQLDEQKFIAMDSGLPHDFDFTEGMSLIVHCEDQAEIDHYWNALTKDGAESQCGWLKDKFGVSWQIVPRKLAALLSEPERAQRVTAAYMKMKKLDLAVLEEA